MSKKTLITNGQITCKKCNVAKDLIYFCPRPENGSYRGTCKMCSKGYKTSMFEKQETVLALKDQGLKKCGKCKEVKDISCFGIDKHTRFGIANSCKECISLDRKGTNKFTALKSRYGVTAAKYNELLTIQKYKCLICSTSLLKLDNRHIHLDHCHTTGKVRGILCSYCNLGLGNFKDQIELLQNAISYLKKYNSK